MIVLRGRSAIAEKLIELLPAGESWIWLERGITLPLGADRYLITQGLIRSKHSSEQTQDEIAEGWAVNYGDVKQACEQILSANDRARICVIGSESGFRGSFDDVYAEAKAQLHAYVETRGLNSPRQQLVCVSPGVIEDAGMTLRRNDPDRLEQRRKGHPQRRFLRSAEVARLVHFLLYVDQGYLSNTVIRMHGGEQSTTREREREARRRVA